MLQTPDTVTWGEAGLLLGGLIGSTFLVSWICTEVLAIGRQAYVGVLIALTAVAWAAVAEATGTSVGDMLTHHWAAGLLGAVAAGLLTGAGLRKKERGTRMLTGSALRATAAWEGLVYGIAEGMLLSALPVFVVWQAADGAGWAAAASWAAALAASAVVIAVHHFGYWDYRNREVAVVVAGCGVFSLAYLITGSLLAAALGHAVMHVIGITGGVVLPPHARPGGGVRAVTA